MEGQIVGGRYEVVRELGRGGMGSVYEARHTGTGRRVAVKVITADLTKSPGLVQRFEVEARAGGGIDSQYIAQVLDTGTDTNGAPYIVMEYLVGEDLYQLIGRIAPLPVDLALRIVGQAALGLEKAHQAKIIHRDIKPANIFLCDREGDEIGIKILDFGVAKIRAEDGQNVNVLTRTGSLLGSPLYMSPEQARGDKQIDHRSDVWALGVVLYEQLCGVTPFHEIEALGSLIIAICGDSPPPIQRRAPWVPPQVATILHKALAQKPDERFQSAHEMYRAIKAVAQGGSLTIQKASLVPLTSDERAYIAPPMNSTEPVLSTSAPGGVEEKVVVRSVYPPPIPSVPGHEGEVESTLRVQTKLTPVSISTEDPYGTMRSGPAAKKPLKASTTTVGGQERARTTDGVTSEQPRAASRARSFVSLGVGAVALAGVAVFAGMRLGGSSNAAPAQPTAEAAHVASPPPSPAEPTVAPTPTAAPVVVPGDAASSATAASASASAAGPATGPSAQKLKAPPNKAPSTSPAPATTSVGGRIIRTDLP